MRLPDFPWDSLQPAKTLAAQHPDGLVDLSVGTPVDPTPDFIQQALSDASNAPGYPTTHGTQQLREAISGWLSRQRDAHVHPEHILPVIGSKELVAWLPTLLDVQGAVAFPELAYPTYEVGALLAGANPVRSSSTLQWGPSSPDLIWVNSPANPNGSVLPVEHLRKTVTWAREREVVVAADECYAGLEWTAPAPSLLSNAVCDGDHTNLLIVHSLSKRSNLAGYRFGFIAGDPTLVRRLLEVRKHAGMIVPAPVQAAAVAAYSDDSHAQTQREIYAHRREILKAALESAGFTIDDSQAGLYLWATRLEPCWDTVNALAELGILVAPGEFYGPAGARHVRVALTATDERIAAAAHRLSA